MVMDFNMLGRGFSAQHLGFSAIFDRTWTEKGASNYEQSIARGLRFAHPHNMQTIWNGVYPPGDVENYIDVLRQQQTQCVRPHMTAWPRRSPFCMSELGALPVNQPV